MQLENKIRFDRPMRPDLASLIAAPMLSERTIAVAGHPTRIILETMVWDGLDEVAHREGRTVADLCGEIEEDWDDVPLDTAIRTFVLQYFREAIRR